MSTWALNPDGAVVRLARLLELNGQASVAAQLGQSSGGGGRGGSASGAAASRAGANPERFGQRRLHGAPVVQIDAPEFYRVFTPSGFREPPCVL